MMSRYLNALADKMAAMAQLSGASPHNPDVGLNRETLLRDVFNNHLPSRLHALLGGVALGLDGSQSRQLDIVIRADNAPRFEEHDRSFFPVESLVAAVSVKSTLYGAELEESLENLASIPQLSAVDFKILQPGAKADFLRKHPTTHIYAFSGYTTAAACLEAVNSFFSDNPDFPKNRIPREIVVHNRYIISHYNAPAQTKDGTPIPANSFWASTLDFEHRGLPLARIVNHAYSYMSWMPYLELDFHKHINAAYGIPNPV